MFNPYESTSTANVVRSRHIIRYLMVFVAFSLFPFLYGCYLIGSVALQPASIPGHAKDGTPAVAGFIIAVIFAPVFATLCTASLWGVVTILSRLIRFAKSKKAAESEKVPATDSVE